MAAERDDEGCAEDDGSGEDGSWEDDAEADASSDVRRGVGRVGLR